MWGGHKRKVGGTSKKFRPALRDGIMPPHLQIASDATVPESLFLTMISHCLSLKETYRPILETDSEH